MDSIDKNTTENILEKGFEFIDTLETNTTDDQAQKHKEKVADTLFSIVFFTVVGNVILWYSPLWISVVFVIPGIALFLHLFLKLKPNNVEFGSTRKNIVFNRSICSESSSNPMAYHNRKSRQERAYGRR